MIHIVFGKQETVTRLIAQATPLVSTMKLQGYCVLTHVLLAAVIGRGRMTYISELENEILPCKAYDEWDPAALAGCLPLRRIIKPQYSSIAPQYAPKNTSDSSDQEP